MVAEKKFDPLCLCSWGLLLIMFLPSSVLAFLPTRSTTSTTMRWMASTKRFLGKNRMEKDEETHLQQHQITFQTSKGDFVVSSFHNETLRTALLRNQIISPHNGRANLINCRGLGTCGTCAIQIQEGDCSPRNAIERTRLSLPPGHGRGNSERLRLACQTKVLGDLVVSKYTGFWGQNFCLAEPSVPTVPLGELEYILDRSRQRR